MNTQPAKRSPVFVCVGSSLGAVVLSNLILHAPFLLPENKPFTLPYGLAEALVATCIIGAVVWLVSFVLCILFVMRERSQLRVRTVWLIGALAGTFPIFALVAINIIAQFLM